MESLTDAEKIINLKRALFQANEVSTSLLKIAETKLMESEQKIEDLEKELNQVKKELKKYTDKEASEKKVIEMHLKKIEQGNRDQK